MAAYAALTSLMSTVDDIENHHSPPISLDKQQVESLTEIVTSLQEFLEIYNSPFADDDEPDPLEMRIADAAYAAEDVIETHIVDTIEKKSSIGEETSTSCIADRDDEQINPNKFHHDLQEVIEQMDQIRKVAMETETDQQLRNEAPSSGTTLTSSCSTTMVGSDGVLLRTLEKLTGDRLDRQVISIVGMGGIGKTTLAKNIYAHPLIKHHFDICAWATISQRYDTREILCEVLSQATNKKKEELSGRSEDELELELYQYLLGRRFLIVMDDMWNIDAWEKMKLYLPNNGNGSRILVTTRLSQLSSQLNDNSSLQMKFLDEVSSWDLFSKTVFGDGSCPPELMEIGKKIAKNCKGLPLSIVVVGGLLKKMDYTMECWESINNNLPSTVNLENDKHCLRLLKMSYNHLPTYLKPCFLYVGVFKEDKFIKVATLIKLWVSEGFVKAKNGESLKTIAKRSLKELRDRNLLVIGSGVNGKIRYCIVHDLLTDLCLTEARRNGFYHVIGVDSYRGISSQRRVVIQRNTPEKKVLEELNSMPHARSIICEYENFPSCRNLRLLRILHAYKRYDTKDNDRSYMYSLVYQNVNLRHLAIGRCMKSSFLSSLNPVWNLQTLIVYGSMSTMPIEIWKMAQIRHIKFFGGSVYLPSLPSDMVIMKNLEKIVGVRNFKYSEEMVKRIPNIKKLKIFYDQLSNGDDYYFTNIKLLSKLETVSVFMMLESKQAPHMQKLTFPHSLESLLLSMSSDFEWEEMLEEISWLPLLQNLTLRDGCFATGKWHVVEGQFPSLKSLSLRDCVGLKQWTVEESHVLPRLNFLALTGMRELEEIPREIGDIPKLKGIWLRHCCDSVVESAKEMEDEQVEMQGEGRSFCVLVRPDSMN